MGPAVLSWPRGEVGYLYTQHLNMMQEGGGAGLKCSSLSHPLQFLSILITFFQQMSMTKS